MKTKFMLNSALAVLVALGVAACSSGGGSVSSGVKKSVDKVKQETKKPLDKAKDEAKKPLDKAKDEVKKPLDKAKDEVKKPLDKAKDKVEDKLTDKKPAPQAVNYASRTVTEHNGKLDSAAFDKFTKERVKFSEAGEIVIEGKKVLVDKIYVVAAGKAVDFANYKTNQWKYQTFGQFISSDEQGNTFEGFVNVGNKTAASAIPTQGVVNYKGNAVAKSLAPHQGMNGNVKADVVVDVDFATKMVSFKTENTQLNQRPMPFLDVMGSAKLDSAKNEFVQGTAHLTKMPRYKGQLEGALFGPNAEEVGGTFNLAEGQFIGGFGAKK